MARPVPLQSTVADPPAAPVDLLACKSEDVDLFDTIDTEMSRLKLLTSWLPRVEAKLEALRPVEARACAELLDLGRRRTEVLQDEDMRASRLAVEIQCLRDLWSSLRQPPDPRNSGVENVSPSWFFLTKETGPREKSSAYTAYSV